MWTFGNGSDIPGPHSVVGVNDAERFGPFNNRVIEVTKAGQIVFQQGETNMAGKGFNLLNGPYDAKQIGDFTGLVPPFDFDGDKDDH